MTHKEIKENYESAKEKRIRDFFKACDAYVKEFCRMYDFSYKDVCWIPSNRVGVGGICSIADYFFNFGDIRLCVDEDVKWNDLIEWYDYNTEVSILGLTTINLKSWLMGAPRSSKEDITEIKARRQELEDLIKQQNEKNGGF